MKRRVLLTAVTTSGAVAIAGCTTTGSSCGPPRDSFDRPRDRWPTAGYDPGNTAYAPSGPSNGERRWQVDHEAGEGPRLNGRFSAPIVDDGVVYVAMRQLDWFDLDDPGYLVALDDETGEFQWRVELPSLAGGDPSLAGDTIFVGAKDTLHAISTAGEHRWTRDLGAAVRTPTVIGDHVYVLDTSATVHGFTLDGERCWEDGQSDFWDGLLGSGSSFEVDSAPAVDDSRVYVTMQEDPDDDRIGHVLAFDHEGNEEWSYSFPTGYEPPSTPAIVDGTVLVTGGDQIVALEATTGKRRWRFVVGHEYTGAPATDGERVYVGAKNLYALDISDGSEQWRVVNHGVTDSYAWAKSIPFMARPAVTDDAVYLRAGAFDPQDGSRLWGGLAEEVVVGSNYKTEQFGRRSVAPLSVAADALYLSHQVEGVTKVA